MAFIASLEHFYDAPLRGEGHSSRWFSYIIRGIGNFVFKVFFRYRIDGRENLDVGEGKAAVLAGNHFSMADPLMVVFALKDNVRFIGKEELFQGPRFLAQGLARCGAIPIKRDTADRQCIKRAVASIKRGEYVGIYPEGTRHHPETGAAQNKAGAVLIANMAHCPIIPVGSVGTERIKPEGSHFLHFPKLVVRFGFPVDPHDFDYLPKPQRAEACIQEVMRRCYALRAGQDPEPFVPPVRQTPDMPAATLSVSGTHTSSDATSQESE